MTRFIASFVFRSSTLIPAGVLAIAAISFLSRSIESVTVQTPSFARVKTLRLATSDFGQADIPVSVSPLLVSSVASGPSAVGWELDFTQEVLRRVKENPEAAVRWAARLVDPEKQQLALENICSGLAEWDPELAISFAQEFGLAPTDRGFVPRLLEQWAAVDRDAAITWAARTPDPETRDDLLTRIALTWALTDPEASIHWLGQAISTEAARREASLAVLAHWADRDPVKAKAWAAATPNPTGASAEAGRFLSLSE